MPRQDIANDTLPTYRHGQRRLGASLFRIRQITDDIVKWRQAKRAAWSIDDRVIPGMRISSRDHIVERLCPHEAVSVGLGIVRKTEEIHDIKDAWAAFLLIFFSLAMRLTHILLVYPPHQPARADAIKPLNYDDGYVGDDLHLAQCCGQPTSTRELQTKVLIARDVGYTSGLWLEGCEVVGVRPCGTPIYCWCDRALFSPATPPS